MGKRKDKAPSRKVTGRNKNKESGRKAGKVMKGIIDSVRRRTN